MPSRLTDDLWLAAHDTMSGATVIGQWPLGVGLAAGLLAELLHAGSLTLSRGELFRTTAPPPDDVALRPVATTMEAEEITWRAAVVHQAAGRHGARRGATSVQAREGLTHGQRGHQLREWLPYLAYEHRAQRLVVDRLTRAGLARPVRQRRLFGRATVRHVPCDSVASGNPASRISIAVQAITRDPSARLRPAAMPRRQLMAAGLFLATGLHHHALSFLTTHERTALTQQLATHLDPQSRELLRAADAVIGDAAMR